MSSYFPSVHSPENLPPLFTFPNSSESFPISPVKSTILSPVKARKRLNPEHSPQSKLVDELFSETLLKTAISAQRQVKARKKISYRLEEFDTTSSSDWDLLNPLNVPINFFPKDPLSTEMLDQLEEEIDRSQTPQIINIDFFHKTLIFEAAPEKSQGSEAASKKGRLYLPETLDLIYEGETKNGIPHGEGTWNCSMHYYSGTFVEGKFEGYGFLKKSDDTTYQGSFLDGKPHGIGLLTYKDGQYEGTFAFGKYHGKGIRRWTDGSSYVGDFFNGIRHGQGTYIYPNTSQYSGSFFQGIRHGQGTYKYANGDLHTGIFISGEPQGFGTFSRRDGFTYIGYWLKGKLESWGKELYPDGSEKYVGCFAQGKYHGKGTLRLQNGLKYTAIFLQGKPEGRGSITDLDGSNYFVEFDNQKSIRDQFVVVD